MPKTPLKTNFSGNLDNNFISYGTDRHINFHNLFPAYSRPENYPFKARTKSQVLTSNTTALTMVTQNGHDRVVKLLVINPNSSGNLTLGLNKMISDLGYSEVCHSLNRFKVVELLPVSFSRYSLEKERLEVSCCLVLAQI